MVTRLEMSVSDPNLVWNVCKTWKLLRCKTLIDFFPLAEHASPSTVGRSVLRGLVSSHLTVRDCKTRTKLSVAKRGRNPWQNI